MATIKIEETSEAFDVRITSKFQEFHITINKRWADSYREKKDCFEFYKGDMFVFDLWKEPSMGHLILP